MILSVPATEDGLMFDHLGLLVADLARGRAILGASLGIRGWTEEFEDPLNDVFVQFGECPSGMCYEVVAPRSVASPVRNALRRRVNIINHLAFRVADLQVQRRRLEGLGFHAIAEAQPAVAYDRQAIQFFINADLFLFELIEAAAHRHRYTYATGNIR